jgi:hypothetical protein
MTPVATSHAEPEQEDVEEKDSIGLLVVSIVLMVVVCGLVAYLVYKEGEQKRKGKEMASQNTRRVEASSPPAIPLEEKPVEAPIEPPPPENPPQANSVGAEGNAPSDAKSGSRSAGIDQPVGERPVDGLWGYMG